MVCHLSFLLFYSFEKKTTGKVIIMLPFRVANVIWCFLLSPSLEWWWWWRRCIVGTTFQRGQQHSMKRKLVVRVFQTKLFCLFFPTPTAFSRVHVVWFHVRQINFLSSLAFKRVTRGRTIKTHFPFLCCSRYFKVQQSTWSTATIYHSHRAIYCGLYVVVLHTN